MIEFMHDIVGLAGNHHFEIYFCGKFITNALGLTNDPPPPPNYTPLANASKESAEIMAGLGRAQLDEAKRQYDLNRATADPVVKGQLALMDQTKTQGDDYYNYMVSKQRPVEDALNADALKDASLQDAARRDSIAAETAGLSDQMSSDAATLRTQGDSIAAAMAAKMAAASGGIRDVTNKYEGDIGKDINFYTSGNKTITDKYGNDIQFDVDNAIADTRAGQAQAINSAIRQAMRYGIAVPEVTAASSMDNARALSAAANGTRVASTDKYRGLVGQGIDMKQNLYKIGSNAAIAAAGIDAQGAQADANLKGAALQNSIAMGQDARRTNISKLALQRDMATQDNAKSWAKKLDVAGLYRGLPGASQGAYSLSNTSGNNAVSNTMAPGNAMIAGMGVGANTMGEGQRMRLGGLGSILGAQTSYNDLVGRVNMGNQNVMGDIVGTAMGAGIKNKFGR